MHRVGAIFLMLRPVGVHFFIAFILFHPFISSFILFLGLDHHSIVPSPCGEIMLSNIRACRALLLKERLLQVVSSRWLLSQRYYFQYCAWMKNLKELNKTFSAYSYIERESAENNFTKQAFFIRISWPWLGCIFLKYLLSHSHFILFKEYTGILE